LTISSRDFRPVPTELLENMDPDLFGFFEFAPAPALAYDLDRALLEAAADRVGRVDAVIFPETSVHSAAIGDLERILAEHGATFLIAGVRQLPHAAELGRNYLHFGVRTESGWNCYEQDKHHRWCLDAPQIRQYHLTRSLTPKKLWWEAIDIGQRRLHVIDVCGGSRPRPSCARTSLPSTRSPRWCDAWGPASSPCFWTGLSWPGGGRAGTRACSPTIPGRQC
jgi:hypothetical protein